MEAVVELSEQAILSADYREVGPGLQSGTATRAVEIPDATPTLYGESASEIRYSPRMSCGPALDRRVPVVPQGVKVYSLQLLQPLW